MATLSQEPRLMSSHIAKLVLHRMYKGIRSEISSSGDSQEELVNQKEQLRRSQDGAAPAQGGPH